MCPAGEGRKARPCNFSEADPRRARKVRGWMLVSDTKAWSLEHDCNKEFVTVERVCYSFTPGRDNITDARAL